jgi:hypothetical protein
LIAVARAATFTLEELELTSICAKLGRIKLAKRTAIENVLQIMIRETFPKMFLGALEVRDNETHERVCCVELNVEELVLQFVDTGMLRQGTSPSFARKAKTPLRLFTAL